MKTKILIMALVIIAATAWPIAIDWYFGTTDSREERIALLEKQMKEKTRPVIHIERATIYNTDGEVIIKTEDRGRRTENK